MPLTIIIAGGSAQNWEARQSLPKMPELNDCPTTSTASVTSPGSPAKIRKTATNGDSKRAISGGPENCREIREVTQGDCK